MKKKGYLLSDALIGVSVLSLTAALTVMSVSSSMKTADLIEEKMEESDIQMQENMMKTEECEEICLPETEEDPDSF